MTPSQLKANKLYAHDSSQTLATFDHWSEWPYLGVFKLSTKKTIKIFVREIRIATEQEQALFNRARKEKVEAMIPKRYTEVAIRNNPIFKPEPEPEPEKITNMDEFLSTLLRNIWK